MAKAKRRAVGIMTGGMDCPGADAAIGAAARAALQFGWDVHGIEDGFDGLLRNKVRRLTRREIPAGPRGGVRLGAGHGVDPFEYPTRQGRAIIQTDRSAEVVRNFKALGLAGLIVVGGDVTLLRAERFHRRGIPVVAVPMSVDNDVSQTAMTFGFDTAVSVAADALDRLYPDAAAHKRVVVVEVIGRSAGWIALHSGLAASADVILIPEIPFTVEAVCGAIRGRECSIVVVAEGAVLEGGKPITPSDSGDRGGIGDRVAADLAQRLKKDVRCLPLGRFQRGGSMSTFDRVLATRFGSAAMRLVDEGLFGNMVALKPPALTAVPLHQVVGKVRQVPLDSDLLRSARDLGIGFGQ